MRARLLLFMAGCLLGLGLGSALAGIHFLAIDVPADTAWDVVVLIGGCEITIRGGAGTGNMDIRSAARTIPGYHDSAYEYGRDYPDAFV